MLLAQDKPNVFIIFADDLGYGDLSYYGAQDVNTIHIDMLADEGLTFTDFQVPASVCSPSRASLMTGRYPMRCGFPVAQHTGKKHENYGLHSDEITLADLLLKKDYATMCIGKWHLGFMEENKAKPFFLYLAYHAVHSPIIPGEAFRGSSRGSLYGDYVQELDFYVGELMKSLNQNGLDENTLVVFLSDNSPAICYFGGSAGALNGGKYSTMEGGFRIPAIIRWPGKYPKGICNTLLSSMDLFPTIATLAGAKIPNDRFIDGKDINSILLAGDGDSPHEYVYYYNGSNLQAVRKGKWKLHLPNHPESKSITYTKWLAHIAPEDRVLFTKPVLYSLETDISETADVSAENPEVVSKLLKLLEWAKTDIGDFDKRGENARPLGDEPYFTPNGLFPEKIKK